jgi:hypothetical protein
MAGQLPASQLPALRPSSQPTTATIHKASSCILSYRPHTCPAAHAASRGKVHGRSHMWSEQPTAKPITVNSCIPPCLPDTCSALPCCLLQLCRPAAVQDPHIAGRLLLLCRTALAQLCEPPPCCCCTARRRLCRHSSWLHAVQKNQQQNP